MLVAIQALMSALLTARLEEEEEQGEVVYKEELLHGGGDGGGVRRWCRLLQVTVVIQK